MEARNDTTYVFCAQGANVSAACVIAYLVSKRVAAEQIDSPGAVIAALIDVGGAEQGHPGTR